MRFVSTTPNSLAREHQTAVMEQIKTAIQSMQPDVRFSDWKRLRKDCLDVMALHTNLKASCASRPNEKPCVKLEGNVRMFYCGAEYWVPLTISLGTEYPRNFPTTIMVRRTNNLFIPSNHARVGSDGTVYLKLLSEWKDRSTVLCSVTELINVFADAPFIFAARNPSAPAPAPPSAPALAEDDESVDPAALAADRMQLLEEGFNCPISLEVMMDPVFAADGHSYERAKIEEWLLHRSTSPVTGPKLANKCITPNHNLRSQILAFLESTKQART